MEVKAKVVRVGGRVVGGYNIIASECEFTG